MVFFAFFHLFHAVVDAFELVGDAKEGAHGSCLEGCLHKEVNLMFAFFIHNVVFFKC